MCKIVLSTPAVVLIAASASQAFAAQKPHHARKAPQATNEQFRDARNAITRPTPLAWPYSGWSAPAGR